MKKTFALLMAASMSFVSLVPAFANETTINQINYNAEENMISIPVLFNERERSNLTVEDLMADYQIQRKTAESLLEILETADLEEMKSIEILQPSLKATRTYKGYKNKMYYEETIKTESQSHFKEYASDTSYANLAKQTMKATILGTIGTKVKPITSITIAVADALLSNLPQGIQQTDEVLYEIKIKETKYKKHTYLAEDGQYYFGSLVERAKAELMGHISFPGVGKKDIDCQPVNLETTETDNYSTPDERAYYAYAMGGVTESISGYQIGGVFFDSY